MKTERITLYEDREDVTLTTYILEDSPEMLKGSLRPAIIICPGGAYMSCSDREGEPVAMKFASMGYHTFVLRYSTYSEGKNMLPDLSRPLKVKEHCRYPNPMLEIGKSILIVREHAQEWKVDTERIAVCGFSAGAHNAAMYATNWHTDIFREHFGEETEMFRPAAAILGYALSDYVYMREKTGRGNQMDAEFFAASNTAFLGSAVPTDELLQKVSPAKNVTEHTPPVFLWATASDELVPVQHSIRMAHALADHNIPFEMHIFEEGPHGLSLSTQASSESKSQVYADAAKWADLAGCWLEKRFALNIPQKSAFEEMLEKGLF
ncbi:MAG: alpha/beta hydrolase [Eubacterium sp.]|nr:alpha/beta hydrolase [Eubacterium sp.]